MEEFCLIVSLALAQNPVSGEGVRCRRAGDLGRVKS